MMRYLALAIILLLLFGVATCAQDVSVGLFPLDAPSHPREHARHQGSGDETVRTRVSAMRAWVRRLGCQPAPSPSSVRCGAISRNSMRLSPSARRRATTA